MATSPFDAILKTFAPISLEQMDNVQLLNRVDRKYILPIDRLAEFFKNVSQDYFVLDIKGNRTFSYDTTYYDTEDFQFYKDHHNGLTHRLKVRYRVYKESNLHFFEIKKKIKGYRTDKYRELLAKFNFDMDDEHSDKVRESYNRKPFDNLKIALYNRFSRITMVNKGMTERCTVDFDIAFSSNKETWIAQSNIAIIEIKQNKASQSPVVNILRQMRIYSSSISKYVLGLILTQKNIKHNAFKFLLHKLEKIKKIA